MIELKQVTKRFGAVTAVEHLSFSAERGQIIGLLGQNGAGKSTTLNMITGYYPPSSGQVLVDGKDMMIHPRECKRHIGYLPQRPPLYDEMTVSDYLRFVSSLREVKNNGIERHVGDILQLCGLTEVRERVLGNLSKGYRQRAGLAQALCGAPEVLVLDEPTVGLDPRQVVEIRELIRRLGEDHTVIFSSHLLSQVQQLCSRALILHRGHLVRDQLIGKDVQWDNGIVMRASVMAEQNRLIPALRGMPCVRKVRVIPGSEPGITDVELECGPGDREHGDPYRQFLHLLCAMDAPIRMLRQRQDSLEQTFLRITSEEGAEA